MSRFTFPDDDLPEENLKFKIGDDIPRFPDIENLTLVIAFDYLSVDGSDLCFNNPSITSEDFRKLFEFKKEISGISLLELEEEKYRYHLSV